MEYQNTVKKPIQRLLEIVKLERSDLYIILLLILGYGLLGIATPVAVQALVNIVTMGGVMQPLYVVSIILFFLLMLSGALYVFESYVVEHIQRRLFVRTAMNVAMNTQGIDTVVYDNANPVELVNRFFDVSNVQKAAATLLTVGLTAFLQGVIGSFILIFYSINFALVVVVILCALTFIVFVLGKNAQATAMEESKVKYATAAWLETIARNYYLFKFYNGLQRSKAITNDYIKTYLDKRSSHFTVLLMQNIGSILLYATAGTFMLAMGGALVIQGQINLGQFVAAELIIFGVLSAFGRFIGKLEHFYDMLAGLDKIGVLQDLPQEQVGLHKLDNPKLEQVAAYELGFQYSDRIKPIQHLSFELKQGQSIAILGASGTGKSTLIGLITGLRAPSTGRVEFNKNDLRQLDQTLVRAHIGLAAKIEFVESSILENVRLSRIDVSLTQINNVLNALGLLQDIQNLEFGIDTMLTAFGAPLSTTQQQLLMLARAIVAQPDLLIVDGLLDNLSHSELDKVINLLSQYQTQGMVIITTRFEMIAAKFDQVLTLK
jgi:ABC-type bacteriocin/lantibiotic exporter with double-glycine peptidase domain